MGECHKGKKVSLGKLGTDASYRSTSPTCCKGQENIGCCKFGLPDRTHPSKMGGQPSGSLIPQ